MKPEYGEMEVERCPNCSRTVKEVNYHPNLLTCIFCDLNKEGGGSA